MKNEFDFIAVTDRAKKAFKINEDKELAEIIGFSTGAFGNRKKTNSLPYDELLRAADSYNVNFNWLITGQGNMYRDESEQPLDSQVQKIVDTFKSLNDAQKTEFSAFIEDKKRLNELEKMMLQLYKTQVG